VRRDFRFPAADEAYLEARKLTWETVVDGSQRWLLVHDWPTPAGYDQSSVTTAILIPPAYPDAALDMVYLSPQIHRADGQQIPAVSDVEVLGEKWQRWSRHYTAQNPWRIGDDDLSTHLTLIDHWLQREFNR
jgi:hypothetical protein